MSHSRPPLKDDVGGQLQSAFHDGNWLVAARLAEKRARTTNDQYYQIVKVCAESQLDDAAMSFSALRAIDDFVRQETVVKDVDGLDLLEWAAGELLEPDGFADSLGVLRVRLVKAAPKDRVAATRCLESCLMHWDLVNAQQIAAILDRATPGERSYMFWNISITHLLAISTQASADKRKLYGTLAQKQIERAAQVTEQARNSAAEDGPPPQPVRGIRTEEEVLLLFEIVDRHGTAKDFAKLFSSPVFSPVSQFRLGRKEPFFRVVEKYSRQGDWQVVFDLCHECLSDGDEDDEPTLLACDWLVLSNFIEAASHLKSVNPEWVSPESVQKVPKLSMRSTTKTVQSLLLSLLNSKRLQPIYRRNILLARLSAAFHLDNGDEDDIKDNKPHSVRLRELIAYLEDQLNSLACFNDVKTFVEKLQAPALRYMAYTHMPDLAKAAQDANAAARLRILAFKMQYIATTCPQSCTRVAGLKPSSTCLICKTDFDTGLCASCLSSISRNALEAYLDKESVETKIGEKEIRPQLALIAALCHINLAFNSHGPGYRPLTAPLPLHLLRALLVLEHQVQLGCQNSQISLLLVQLHLRLGSVYRANQIWKDLAVKRTIVDSLAPIFCDRLSTIAPVALWEETWGQKLLDVVRSHYDYSLKRPMPRQLIDAFESGCYISTLEIPQYIESLRASCTRVMSLVEETRVERLAGNYDEFFDDSRYVDVRDETSLREIIDYGSFPRWECSSCVPLYVRLGLGPGPSNVRSHLSLYAEAFHQVLGYKPSVSYKVGAAGCVPSQEYVAEQMDRIQNSMAKFLIHAGAKCTDAEMLYFSTVFLLARIFLRQTHETKTKDTLEHLNTVKKAVCTALNEMLAEISQHEEQKTSTENVVALMMALHTATLLRDTITATTAAAKWLQDNGNSNNGVSKAAKQVVAEAKALQGVADEAWRTAKARFAQVDIGSGFAEELRGWVLKDNNRLGELGMGLQELQKSWAKNLDGWKRAMWV